MNNTDQGKTIQHRKQNDPLESLRININKIDNELLLLLSQRRKTSRLVAKAKQKVNRPLRDQPREKKLLEFLLKKADGMGLEASYVSKIFYAIIEDSVQYQQDYLQQKNQHKLERGAAQKLAVLGGKGAYSYLAAKRHFINSQNKFLACSSFESIFHKVQQAEADYGVIPIENTTSGGITEVYDLLLENNLYVVGEEKFIVNHCLVAQKNCAIADITQIAAHPQASQQCSHSLKEFSNKKLDMVESTAHALELVCQQSDSKIAAIASKESAELFGLTILKEDLANQSSNITRFLILAKTPQTREANQNKTSLALSTGQQAGSLAEVLMLFREAKIPLSKLESRPIPNKPWEQMFYIDLYGSTEDKTVQNTLATLRRDCLFLKIFGSYPTKDIAPTQIDSSNINYYKIDKDDSKNSVG